MPKFLIRTLAFFGKWSAEVLQQPALLLSLVVGPFLILLAFGIGVKITLEVPEVALVAGDSWRSDDELSERIGNVFDFTARFSELPPARAMLERGEVDAVVVLPPLRTGITESAAEVTLLTDSVNAQEIAFAYTQMSNAVSSLNHAAVEVRIAQAQVTAARLNDAIAEAQELAGAAGVLQGEAQQRVERLKQDLSAVSEQIEILNSSPAWALARPFRMEQHNLAEVVPDNVGFYGPAVLVLLLQHLAITLGALSMSSMRLLGIQELLRVSPTKPSEVVVGHYLSYVAMAAVVGLAMTLLLVYALGVPQLGDPLQLLGVLTLLTLSSLGIGFVIALVSSSEQQAAQITMLVLLASIFFSGLLFSLEQVQFPARPISAVLPATYAIDAAQMTMLRGADVTLRDVGALSGMAGAYFVLAVLLMKREWKPSR